MTVKVFFVLFLWTTSAFSQPPRVRIVDSTYIKAINVFIDSTEHLSFNFPVAYLVEVSGLEIEIVYESRPNAKYGQVVARKEVPSYELTISLNRVYTSFIGDTPVFVHSHRGKKFYVSLNTEALFEFDQNYREKVRKQIRNSLEKRELGSSIVAVMKIKVEGTKLSISPLMGTN